MMVPALLETLIPVIRAAATGGRRAPRNGLRDAALDSCRSHGCTDAFLLDQLGEYALIISGGFFHSGAHRSSGFAREIAAYRL